MNIEITEQFGEFESLKEIQLDKIVEVSFNEIILKQNFELLIKVLESHRAYMNRLNERNKLHEQQLKECTGSDELRKSLEERIAELEKKQMQSDQKFQEYKTTSENEIDELKQNDQNINIQIEVIKNNCDTNEKSLQDLEEISNKQTTGINALQKEILELQQAIEDLKQNHNEVQIITPNTDNTELANSFNSLQMQINKSKTNIADLTSQINKMVEKTDLELLKQSLDDLRKEVNTIDSQYVQKQEFEPFKTIEVPTKFGEINTQIEGANEEIEQLKGQIQGLYDLLNKINSSDKKEIIEIPQINPAQSVDNGKVKALENRIKALENKILLFQQLLNEKQTKLEAKDELQNLQKLLAEKLDKSEFKLDPLLELLNIVQDNLQKEKSNIKKNENNIASLMEEISNLRSFQPQVIKEKPKKEPVVTINEDGLKDFFRNELNQMKDMLLKLINGLQNQIEQKADKSELQALEDQIREMLNNIMNELKKFVSKTEFKKIIAQIDAKIRELQTLLIGDREKRFCIVFQWLLISLDGLFVKRPLAWSCASCDHNLDKFKGRLGEQVNWAVFPPKETSPLRMGKYAMHYASEIAQKKLEIVENSMNQSKSYVKTEQNFFPSSQTNRQQALVNHQQMSSTNTQFHSSTTTGLKIVSKTTMPSVKRNSSTKDFEVK